MTAIEVRKQIAKDIGMSPRYVANFEHTCTLSGMGMPEAAVKSLLDRIHREGGERIAFSPDLRGVDVIANGALTG
jgi:hypothetical protein